MQIRSAKNLVAYKKTYHVAMGIFETSQYRNHQELVAECKQVGALLGGMNKAPDLFRIRRPSTPPDL